MQRMPIPWITMDFVAGLPLTLVKFDSILMIVDLLTKSIYFILMKVTYNAEKLSKIYIKEIV